VSQQNRTSPEQRFRLLSELMRVAASSLDMAETQTFVVRVGREPLVINVKGPTGSRTGGSKEVQHERGPFRSC